MHLQSSRWQKILLAILLIELAVVSALYSWDKYSSSTLLNSKLHSNNQNSIPSPIPTLQVLTPTPPKFSIIAGGTVVLSRGVAERINRYQNPAYPWQKIAGEFQRADLAIINFKGPLTNNCTYKPETLKFCGQPEYIKGLTYTGIDLVSLAGNHIGDYGTKGILETIKILDQNQILHAGAGNNFGQAHQAAIFEVPSSSPSVIRIGFLAYNSVATQTPTATTNSPGIAWLTLKNLETDIRALRPQVDILIVMPNWGQEYTHKPSSFQIKMGRAMIDLGADLVLGDQAHWVQKIEKYKGKYIFYGLGNLVFDQMWSQKTREGLVVKFNFEGANLKSLDPMPVIIENYAQPRWADKKEKEKILKDLLQQTKAGS